MKHAKKPSFKKLENIEIDRDRERQRDKVLATDKHLCQQTLMSTNSHVNEHKCLTM